MSLYLLILIFSHQIYNEWLWRSNYKKQYDQETIYDILFDKFTAEIAAYIQYCIWVAHTGKVLLLSEV